MKKPEWNDDPGKKRKHVRYRPDRLTTAKIQLDAVTSSFVSEASALVYEESYGGCCLIVINERPVALQDRWRIQVGNLQPMIAEVVWVKRLDDAVYKVGMKFLE